MPIVIHLFRWPAMRHSKLATANIGLGRNSPAIPGFLAFCLCFLERWVALVGCPMPLPNVQAVYLFTPSTSLVLRFDDIVRHLERGNFVVYVVHTLLFSL